MCTNSGYQNRDIYFAEVPAVDFSARLPVTIDKDEIDYGMLKMFYPEEFYQKYQLGELTRAPGQKNMREWYFILDEPDRIGVKEKKLMAQAYADSLIAFRDEGRDYIFIASCSSGSSNNTYVRVRLYEKNKGEYELAFSVYECYATDPGIDSSFFWDKLRLFVYKIIHSDERYDDKVNRWNTVFDKQ